MCNNYVTNVLQDMFSVLKKIMFRSGWELWLYYFFPMASSKFNLKGSPSKIYSE